MTIKHRGAYIESNSPDAKGILDDLAKTTGWNTDTKLRLACEYIDGIIGGIEGFSRFVGEVAVDDLEEEDYDQD